MSLAAGMTNQADSNSHIDRWATLVRDICQRIVSNIANSPLKHHEGSESLPDLQETRFTYSMSVRPLVLTVGRSDKVSSQYSGTVTPHAKGSTALAPCAILEFHMKTRPQLARYSKKKLYSTVTGRCEAARTPG
jgi:hypothetical protein